MEKEVSLEGGNDEKKRERERERKGKPSITKINSFRESSALKATNTSRLQNVFRWDLAN